MQTGRHTDAGAIFADAAFIINRDRSNCSALEAFTGESMKREYGKDGNNGTNGKKSRETLPTISVCSVISVFSVLSLPSAEQSR